MEGIWYKDKKTQNMQNKITNLALPQHKTYLFLTLLFFSNVQNKYANAISPLP